MWGLEKWGAVGKGGKVSGMQNEEVLDMESAFWEIPYTTLLMLETQKYCPQSHKLSRLCHIMPLPTVTEIILKYIS